MSAYHDYVQHLVGKGIPLAHAQGWVANMPRESSGNPGAIGDNGNSIGLNQWNGPRKRALQSYASKQGKDWRDPYVQLDYGMTEPDTQAYLAKPYQSGMQAAEGFLRNWERPAHPDKDWAKTQQDYQKIFGSGDQFSAGLAPRRRDAQMNPRLLSAMQQQQPQQQPQQPPGKFEQLMTDPMFQMGMNILAAPGNYGNWAQSVGQGMQDTMGQMASAQQMRQKQEDQARRAAGLAQKEDRGTAHMQDWAEHQRILQEDGPEAAAKFWDYIQNQKDPAYWREKALQTESGNTLPERVTNAQLQMKISRDIINKSLRVGDTLGRIQQLSGAAGWQQMFSWVKDSDPSVLRSTVEQLKSSVVLDEMKRLKELSAQGATGFGAMSEKELGVLINSIESLDLNNPSTLPERLSKVLHHYRNVAEDARGSYRDAYNTYQKYNPKLPDPNVNEYSPVIPNYWENLNKTRQDLQTGQTLAPGSPTATPPAPSGGIKFLGFE